MAEAFSYLDLDGHERVQVDLSLMWPSDIAKSCGNAAKVQAILGWQSEATYKAIVHTTVEGCVD